MYSDSRSLFLNSQTQTLSYRSFVHLGVCISNMRKVDKRAVVLGSSYYFCVGRRWVGEWDALGWSFVMHHSVNFAVAAVRILLRQWKYGIWNHGGVSVRNKSHCFWQNFQGLLYSTRWCTVLHPPIPLPWADCMEWVDDMYSHCAWDKCGRHDECNKLSTNCMHVWANGNAMTAAPFVLAYFIIVLLRLCYSCAE